jgi:hypothetical protein
MTKEDVKSFLKTKGDYSVVMLNEQSGYEIIRIIYLDEKINRVFGGMDLEIIDGYLNNVLVSGGWDVFKNFCSDTK